MFIRSISSDLVGLVWLVQENSNGAYVINCAVPVKQAQVVFICGDETISKYLYNIFLAIQRIRRTSLAGFGENNGVVYAK